MMDNTIVVPPAMPILEPRRPVPFPLLFFETLVRPKRVFSNLDAYSAGKAIAFWFVLFVIQVLAFAAVTLPAMHKNAGTVGGTFLQLGTLAYIASAIVPLALIVPFSALTAVFTVKALQRRNIAITKTAIFNAGVFAFEPLYLLSILALLPGLSSVSFLQPIMMIWSLALLYMGLAWHAKTEVSQIFGPLTKASIVVGLISLPITIALLFFTLFGGLMGTLQNPPTL